MDRETKAKLVTGVAPPVLACSSLQQLGGSHGPALVEVKPPTWRIYILKDWYFLMGQRKTEENNSCVLDLTAQFCWVSTLSYADLKPNCCGSLVGMCGSHARSF
ncbi:hypothetical protein ACFX13_001904 [Malus domestica]